MKSILVALFCSVLCCGVAFSQETRKIDEFDEPTCDEYLAHMDNAIVMAAQDPNVKVQVLIYEGHERNWNAKKNKTGYVLPVAGQADARIQSMKRYIALRKFPVDRFEFVKAGFRNKLSVEIWLIPPGAEDPKPTPTLKRTKYRNGKPKGFCVWCC